MGILPGELVISDDNFLQFTDPEANAARGFGLQPRDYRADPFGSHAVAEPYNLNEIPQDQWSARIKADEQARSRLSDIWAVADNGKPGQVLDQGQSNFCWAHSTTHANMFLRARMGEPYIPLSAFAVACIIKGYRNEGGWCQQSLEFFADKGCPSQQYWPQGSMSSSNDNSLTWANAVLHKTTKWFDVPSRNFGIVASLLLRKIPVVLDLNWWGHSVCAIDLVEITPNKFGVRIINSWGKQWGEGGFGILTESRGTPDNSVAPYAVRAA